MISKGPINHSNTLSFGPFILVNSTSSSANAFTSKHEHIYVFQWNESMAWAIKAVHITNPSEFDFAEVRRHCSKDQAGNLMLNFLQLPLKMHSSISFTLIRPSRRTIRPFTSHDLKNQSHTCKITILFKFKKFVENAYLSHVTITCTGLYCWIFHFTLLDCCRVCFEFCELSLLFFKLWSFPSSFFLSSARFAFLRYTGLAVTSTTWN